MLTPPTKFLDVRKFKRRRRRRNGATPRFFTLDAEKFHSIPTPEET